MIMDVTRRSFFSSLLCIPIPFVFGRLRKAESALFTNENILPLSNRNNSVPIDAIRLAEHLQEVHSISGMMDYPFLRKQLNDYTSTFYGPHACHRCTVPIIKQAIKQGGDEYEFSPYDDHIKLFKRHEPHCYPELKAELKAVHSGFYVDTRTGQLISDREIRLFLDWTPQHPEQPRYARICYIKKPILSGYRGMERARVWQQNIITTYLDSELRPWSEHVHIVLGPTQEGMTLDTVREREGLHTIGESFKFKFTPWTGI
jgi:hypothetical protein